jgi:hypothetical protein
MAQLGPMLDLFGSNFGPSCAVYGINTGLTAELATNLGHLTPTWAQLRRSQGLTWRNLGPFVRKLGQDDTTCFCGITAAEVGPKTGPAWGTWPSKNHQRSQKNAVHSSENARFRDARCIRILGPGWAQLVSAWPLNLEPGWKQVEPKLESICHIGLKLDPNRSR